MIKKDKFVLGLFYKGKAGNLNDGLSPPLINSKRDYRVIEANVYQLI